MTSFPKSPIDELYDAAENSSLDEAVEIYNELADKNDPDVVPVLILNLNDVMEGDFEDKLSDENVSEYKQ